MHNHKNTHTHNTHTHTRSSCISGTPFHPDALLCSAVLCCALSPPPPTTRSVESKANQTEPKRSDAIRCEESVFNLWQSGEHRRRAQSDNGVSFHCSRLKCELYLNVCLSISISLWLIIGCLTLSVLIDLQRLRLAPLSLSLFHPERSLCNRIACKLTNCQLRFPNSSSSSLWATHANTTLIRFLKRV